MILRFFIVILISMSASFSFAAEAESYDVTRAEIDAFASQYAKKHKLKKTDVLSILAKGKKQESILEAISRPAEKRLTWADYRKIFVEPKRLRQGIAFWKENRQLLQEVSKKYQVDPEIIVAIIGVETRYGRITGSYRVLDALMTLGFDYPPRSKFFLKQLEAYLDLTRKQNLDPTSHKGSYAGAMGYGQFIPSSYLHFAVDHNNDGVANIWTDKEDAIASVANYFAKHKWRYGDLVALQLNPQKVKKELLSKSLKRSITIKALREAGIQLPVEIKDDVKVSFMQHEGANNIEYWIGFNNFYAITRYNHSSMYALAAFQLSQLLKLHIDMP